MPKLNIRVITKAGEVTEHADVQVSNKFPLEEIKARTLKKVGFKTAKRIAKYGLFTLPSPDASLDQAVALDLSLTTKQIGLSPGDLILVQFGTCKPCVSHV